jgi:hypothetical protein
MRNFLAQNGMGGLKAEKTGVPGATKAVLVTLPASSGRQISKYLLAAYRQGTIQVSMTAPREVPDSRLKAVMALIASS